MIFTASKRPRKLQDVPISIFALPGDKMESSGITQIEDLSDAVAGLEIVSAGDGVLRGVETC